MVSPWFGEFMGTLVLIRIGNGVVAGVLLKRSPAEDSGWMVITAGWAFAIFYGVFAAVASGSPDAHRNPAVTLGMAVKSGDYSQVLSFFSAQLLGAFAGAALLFLQYMPHWEPTPDASLKLAVFSTSPAIRNLPLNFVSAIIVTFLLVFVVQAIFSKNRVAGWIVGRSRTFFGRLPGWGVGLSVEPRATRSTCSRLGGRG
jgi:glycerol uptake facilitator protein